MNTKQERAAFDVWIDLHPLAYPSTVYEAFVAGYRAALSQDRKDAQEIAATLATVLHFIPRSEEPELYADVEKMCSAFSDHARRIEGDGK